MYVFFGYESSYEEMGGDGRDLVCRGWVYGYLLAVDVEYVFRLPPEHAGYFPVVAEEWRCIVYPDVRSGPASVIYDERLAVLVNNLGGIFGG